MRNYTIAKPREMEPYAKFTSLIEFFTINAITITPQSGALLYTKTNCKGTIAAPKEGHNHTNTHTIP